MFRVLLVLAIACAGALLPSTGSASQAYRAFAIELLQSRPQNVAIRPDLEAYLDGLAAEARRAGGRPPVESSDLLRDAARAQALEMLQGNYVGHQSKSGFQFKHRFEAFADPWVHGNHGENAARDRQNGPVDRDKARRLFTQWVDSTGHRRNLMNRDYRYVSTGAVEIGHHLYAVQIFWER
ncbi:MAG TPA: CAP domain-containing protein [Aestuariivirgaceae bacterium]|nr:CAP domain-containing protein [Aestuariivirgaceae bacterium]